MSDLKPSVHLVSAAMRNADGMIIASPRHWDKTCHQIFQMLTPQYQESFRGGRGEQGFIDTRGNFYTRSEAYAIAQQNGQYGNGGHPPGSDTELFSEDLY